MTRLTSHWFFTALVFCALLLPLLSRDGMFFDGTIYAAISKNMAHGSGTLWAPYYSATLSPVFCDHPPLVFGIQSLFFRMFGDHFWVERLYDLLMALITVLLIVRLWKQTAGIQVSKLSWLPVLLWLAIPLVHWAYSNNMMEDTMTIFTTLSVCFLWLSVKDEKVKYAWIIPAAAMLWCAFLSKGFTGCFPLGFYFIHWLVYRKYSFSKMIVHTLVFAALTALVALPFLVNDQIRFALSSYIDQQVIRSIQGNREIDSHTFILGKLFLELSIVMTITTVMMIIARRKSIKLNRQPGSRHALFFLLVALSASLPIVISPKQSGFYVLPSLPLFALAAALFIAPAINSFTLAANKRTNTILSSLFTAGIMGIIIWCMLHFGEVRRDKDKLEDIRLIGRNIEAKELILCNDLQYDWSLCAYFMRYNSISAGNNAHSKYYLADTNCISGVPEGYIDVKLPLKVYRLFKAAP